MEVWSRDGKGVELGIVERIGGENWCMYMYMYMHKNVAFGGLS